MYDCPTVALDKVVTNFIQNFIPKIEELHETHMDVLVKRQREEKKKKSKPYYHQKKLSSLKRSRSVSVSPINDGTFPSESRPVLFKESSTNISVMQNHWFNTPEGELLWTRPALRGDYSLLSAFQAIKDEEAQIDLLECLMVSRNRHHAVSFMSSASTYETELSPESSLNEFELSAWRSTATSHTRPEISPDNLEVDVDDSDDYEEIDDIIIVNKRDDSAYLGY